MWLAAWWWACTSPEIPVRASRLADSTSPYLRQHADNPVDWYPWGDEAFEAAFAAGKPVFLSIGYSTCHWCHVMEHESFEDPAIAALLDERFVSVKVDREERPDVDAVYMAAVQALTGRGGWPMTLVLTPDTREVLFAATYLPPRDGDRGMARGLASVLTELSDRWNDSPDAMRAQAEGLSRHLAERNRPSPGAGVPGIDAAERAVDQLLASADPVHGGFGRAPRFPRPVSLALLVQDGRPEALAHARHTVATMASSAIHDALGAGWHRYTTDDAWRVPHFERMLPDQALLASLFVDLLPHEPRAGQLLDETVQAMLRDFRLPSGALASAHDADSLGPDGELTEGAWFTWTPDELEAAVGPDEGAWLSERFQVEVHGPVEGRSPLHAGGPLSEPERARFEALAPALRSARARRAPPARDDKVVTAWNAWALSAWARASASRPGLRDEAVRLAEALLASQLDAHGRVLRSSFDGRPGAPGTLDDVAALTAALLDLHEATGDPRWWEAADTLHGQLVHFEDPDGGWFQTADDAEALLLRPRLLHEGVEPHPVAVAARNALRLSAGRGHDPALVEQADRALAALAARAGDRPSSFPSLASVARERHLRRWQLVVVRPPGADDSRFLEVAARHTDAWLVRGRHGEATPPVIADKPGPVATAYLCEAGRCLAPLTDPAALEASWPR